MPQFPGKEKLETFLLQLVHFYYKTQDVLDFGLHSIFFFFSIFRIWGKDLFCHSRDDLLEWLNLLSTLTTHNRRHFRERERERERKRKRERESHSLSRSSDRFWHFCAWSQFTLFFGERKRKKTIVAWGEKDRTNQKCSYFEMPNVSWKLWAQNKSKNNETSLAALLHTHVTLHIKITFFI